MGSNGKLHTNTSDENKKKKQKKKKKKPTWETLKNDNKTKLDLLVTYQNKHCTSGNIVPYIPTHLHTHTSYRSTPEKSFINFWKVNLFRRNNQTTKAEKKQKTKI